ncbi:hypothetical protein REPUB_Repub14bG0142800 [Reevesia pubescens]
MCIGAYICKSYAAFLDGKLNDTFKTARDHEGHGSYTLSTVGGDFVPGVSVFGYDIMAAFDAAISDGVDVLSVSLGGEASEFFGDGLSIGTFHEIKKGISVVLFAGNSGPTSGSVLNASPWMFTIGASTLDREFTSYVELGNKKHLKGASLASVTLKSRISYPLISAEEAKAANASAVDA